MIANGLKVKIYVIAGSHPCAAVIAAAKYKGIDHKLVHILPGMQPIVATMLFGGRTVPAIKISGGSGAVEKVQGTGKCLLALESLAPEPSIYPAQAAERERMLEAETFGLGEFQDAARRIAWAALQAKPDALFSYAEPGTLPLPIRILKPFGQPTMWFERKLNHVNPEATRRDLELLPESIAQIEQYIAAGTIGSASPNAADFVIFSTIWLLRSIEDLRPMLDSVASGRKAAELFGEPTGRVPAGAFDPAWLTEVNAARGAAINS